MTITTRAGKGSPLTNAELDANWADIEANKAGLLAAADLAAGSVNVTMAAHLNRPLDAPGVTTLVFAARATSGATKGSAFEATAGSAGSITAAGTCSAAAGYTLVAGPGVTFTARYDYAADAFHSTTPSAVAASGPAFVSAAIDNGSPASLAITFSAAIDAVAAPAAAAFALTNSGSAQTVSSVAVAAAVATLTLSRATLSGETVKVGYVPPALNPLQTSTGDLAVGFGLKPVTNSVAGAIAATFSGTTSLFRTVAASPPVPVYYDNNGGTSFTQIAQITGALAGDGWIEANYYDIANSGGILALDAVSGVDNATLPYTNADAYVLFVNTTGNVLWGAGSGATTSVGTPFAGVSGAAYLIRIRRVGTTVTIETSADTGATWTVRYTFAGIFSGPLYARIYLDSFGSNRRVYAPKMAGFA